MQTKGENKSETPRAEPQERIAKRMARAGLCSRREAEGWITAGRVSVNGRKLTTPAFTVGPSDRIEVDGNLLQTKERTRLWLYNKPSGLVSTNRDPQGRKTVFEALPESMPRVISIGRLDINTEGLLLLTNDGGLARALELPETGWLRRYRVRAHGSVTQQQLDALAEGIAVDGILYGSIDAQLEREQGANVWITMAFREGKNREVKQVLGSLGLEVNRLIRVSYGPFQLGDLASGEVREIRGRTLREQLGEKLIEKAGADFESAAPGQARRPAGKRAAAKPGAGISKEKPGKNKPDTKRKQRKGAEDPLAKLSTKKPMRSQPGKGDANGKTTGSKGAGGGKPAGGRGSRNSATGQGRRGGGNANRGR